MPTAPQLSVVVPLYNETENLSELHRRLTRSLCDLSVEYELVFVDDGSRDATGTLLDELAETDPRLTVLHLSRNFGHQAALCAGIDHARGKSVVLMDGDLQDPPEVLGQLLRAWQDGNDVVYAVRTRRKEGRLKRFSYALFYRLLRASSELDIPLDSGDFCLMDRKVVKALKALPERQRFVRGLRSFVGFKQVGLIYERDARHAGQPKYTFRKLACLAVDGLVSFSGLPLTVVTYLGICSLVLALLLGTGVCVDAWINPSTPRGWVYTIIAVLFLSGVQFVGLGVIGAYLWRMVLEVKGRPAYIVDRITGAARKTGRRSLAKRPRQASRKVSSQR
jgi:glycosyltransferase involved in cell wall biosynthesis